MKEAVLGWQPVVCAVAVAGCGFRSTDVNLFGQSRRLWRWYGSPECLMVATFLHSRVHKLPYMSVSDLAAGTRRALREADYTRAYMFDKRFRALSRPENHGRYLTYFCYAGLANRFRSHFAASLVAREINRQVFPIWIHTLHLKSDATDVFEQKWTGPQGGFPHRYVGLGAASIMSGDFRSLAEATQQLIVLKFDLQWLPIDEIKNVLGPKQNVEFQFRSDLIKMAKELIASVSRPYLAVHIRQTDFATNTNNYKPMSYYETEILTAVQRRSGVPKYRTLLVASDDRVNISPSILELFENVVILNPEKGRQEAGVAGEALIHLLSLGVADGFVGTPRSSFSEFAEAMHSGSVIIPGLSG